MTTAARRCKVLTAFTVAWTAMGMIAVNQNQEQESEIDEAYHWRTTGRVWTSQEINTWRNRINNLQWSDTDECSSTRTQSLSGMGTHTLGWAKGRTTTTTGGDEGRYVGSHFSFDDDHWIVLQPIDEEWSWYEDDVLATLLHELIHHFASDDNDHSERMGCFTIDSGW